MPSNCRFCGRPAVCTWAVEGLTDRGEPDARRFDACKDHGGLVRESRWDELIASADDKAVAMDLAQLAARSEVRISDEPKIGIESVLGPMLDTMKLCITHVLEFIAERLEASLGCLVRDEDAARLPPLNSGLNCLGQYSSGDHLRPPSGWTSQRTHDG